MYTLQQNTFDWKKIIKPYNELVCQKQPNHGVETNMYTLQQNTFDWKKINKNSSNDGKCNSL